MTGIIELRQGGSAVRVAPELGGRITRATFLDRDGRPVELFHPYPEGNKSLLHWAKGGMYPLIPYWGRIANAQLLQQGRQISLSPHPDAVPHTLHGTAHQCTWQVARQTESELDLLLDKAADSHWPWRYETQMSIVLQPDSLRVSLSLRNADRDSMPGGIGLHPYLNCAASSSLRFAARESWSMTQDFLALESLPVGPDQDFSRKRRIGDPGFTHCYGGWSGSLTLQNETASLNVSASPTLDHLVLHRPADAPYICIEPVSHTADAFNRAAAGVARTGARILEPGQRLQGSVELALH
ncbi:MAG: aldose 1-epimerase [Proteobacteria bacterium]|nr:aldose 1-epimerase [Pseudomonadota bacterium]